MMEHRRRAECNLTIMQQIEELKNWHKQQQQNIQQPKIGIISDKQNMYSLPVDTSMVEKEGQAKLDNTLSGTKKNIECDTVGDDTVAFRNQLIGKDFINFDELPINPKNTDFDKLIENCLETSNACNTSSVKTKKHNFLKKGEGTARFGIVSSKPSKKYSVNDTKKVPVAKPQNLGKNQVTKYISGIPSTESYTNSQECFNNYNSVVDFPKSQDQTKAKDTSWKTVFTSVSPSPKSSDAFQLNVSTDSVMLSFIEKILALEEASRKECEELKIFELLEQRVLDSSFSSNSSIIARLMENSVKSTPVKCKSSSDRLLYDTECHNNNSRNSVNSNVCSSTVVKSSCDEVIKTGGIIKEDVEPINHLSCDSNGKCEKTLHVHFAENDSYKSFENVNFDSKERNEMQLYTAECRRQDLDSFDDCEEWSGGNGMFENNIEYSSSEEDCRPVSPPSPLPHSSHKTKNTNRKTSSGNMPKVESCEDTNYRIHCVTNSNITNENTDNPIQATELQVVDAAIKTDELIHRSVIEARLQELETEIETFRSENIKLRKLRSEYNQEYKKFQNEKKEFLKQLNEEKTKIASDLEENKRKLAKERLVHEKYSKTVNKNASKQERAEILVLKQKLAELQEEIKKKESRWGASQARVRNQMRQLEEDNKRLKDEIEQIKMSTRNCHLSSHRIQENPVSNTQLIHMINKQLSDLGFKYVLPDFKEDSLNYYNQIQKFGSRKCLGRNKNTEELKKVHRNFTGSHIKSRDTTTNSEGENSSVKEIATFKQVSVSENNVGSVDEHEVTDKMENASDEQNTVNSKAVKEILIPDAEKILNEMVFPDGRKEIYYPNGNTKKISPRGDITKIIYFNGDVKETNEDGTIKYYYAESKVWHTTYPDGLEVLDYPNGLVEQRYKDGTVNVTYPNGSKKCTYRDSSEEWFYPDGSTMKINVNNDKILTLPNGQKEFHTKEHMRREYPDGTIKFVYPDGTQETRYSNGRIRLKDKSGNLVMDSGNI